MDTITVFAPATVANLGPGFDVLGCAVDGLGDWVTATLRPGTGITIERIEGEAGRLPLDAERNTAGIAAREALRLIGADETGLALSVVKGLPLGSGLGSSGASAAAAAWAVNCLFGKPLGKEQLLHAGLVAESQVSGWHADNVGPALFGGFVLIRSYDPLDIIELPSPYGLTFVLVTPQMELNTKETRAALPKEIPIRQHVANSGNLATMIAALFGGSVRLLGKAMQDTIVEPVRGPLIPGFEAVKRAASEAGALGVSIAGAGPTLYAICEEGGQGRIIASAMQRAFQEAGHVASTAHVAQVDPQGARVV